MNISYNVTDRKHVDNLGHDVLVNQEHSRIEDFKFSIDPHSGVFMWHCKSRGISVNATPGWEGARCVPVEISDDEGIHLDLWEIPLSCPDGLYITLAEYLAMMHTVFAYIRSEKHPAAGGGEKFPVKSPAPGGKTVPSPSSGTNPEAGGAAVEAKKKVNGPVEFYYDVLKWNIHDIRVDADTDSNAAIQLLVYQFVRRNSFEDRIDALQDVTPRSWAFQVGKAALRMMDDLEGIVSTAETDLHDGKYDEK